jgi:hypothetical protein
LQVSLTAAFAISGPTLLLGRRNPLTSLGA